LDVPLRENNLSAPDSYSKAMQKLDRSNVLLSGAAFVDSLELLRIEGLQPDQGHIQTGFGQLRKDRLMLGSLLGDSGPDIVGSNLRPVAMLHVEPKQLGNHAVGSVDIGKGEIINDQHIALRERRQLGHGPIRRLHFELPMVMLPD